MSLTVRFAPSPTGLLHVGNARVALFNWLFARAGKGRAILRLDDTDPERSTRAYAEGIRQDLDWLALDFDHVEKQSDRLDRYDLAVEKLKAQGLLYACYETPEELDLKRKRQLARGLPPVYDRAALELDAGQIAAFETEGRRPHWRFRLAREVVYWDDLFIGETRADCASLSDPVLIRADGTFLYTLPSVVDDIEMGISHVIRGNDHLTNSGAQIQVFRALGADPPRFGHHSLLVGPDGEKFSKRQTGDLSIRVLRERGFEPMALASMLARLGASQAPEPCLAMDELIGSFDLSGYGQGAVRFDPAELERVNAALLHITPFPVVRARLAALGMEDEAFWNGVRANLTQLSDADAWWRIIREDMVPVISPEDAEYIAAAAQALPPEPWNSGTWKAWTGDIKRSTGRKGKALFMPLRLALTGQAHGPELGDLLPLMGRERVLTRLGVK